MASINFNVAFAGQPISPGYKFKDIKLDLERDESKRDFRDSLDIEAVKNSVRNIFTWRPGERILQPEFGNNLYRFLFEPINEVTSRNLGQEVTDMFDRWEPRVNIEKVTVTPFPDQNEFRVVIIFSIPSLRDSRLEISTLVSRDGILV